MSVTVQDPNSPPVLSLAPSTTHIPFPRRMDAHKDGDLVLVVDDQQSVRFQIGFRLQQAGYRVAEASNGLEALEMLPKLRPDLVLLDVEMPGLNGFEVCRRIKDQEQTRLTPVIIITSLQDQASQLAGIESGADDFLPKDYEKAEAELLARVRALIRQKHLNEDLDNAAHVLFAIARTVESRDPTTGDHCERLVIMGEKFGSYLGLSRPQVKALRWGGYLHDIGKIGIPDGILGKRGIHTPEEWAVMQTHVTIGENICQSLRTMQDVLPIIRHHHERWDGSGYPDHLQGEQIPLLARIFQVIDIYDALTSERPYKKAFSAPAAIKLMQEETLKGWRDPNLVREFCDFLFVTEPSFFAESDSWEDPPTAPVMHL